LAVPAKRREGRGPSVSILELPCPVCGETLRHRIVHVRARGAEESATGPGAASGKGTGVTALAAGTTLEGIARCLQCRTPHPFSLRPRPLEPVWVVVSLGPVSERHRIHLPADRRLELGETLRVGGRPVRLSRLEGPQGRNLAHARPADLVTLWAVTDDELSLRVSVLQGARTIPLHLTVRADDEVRVGDEHTVEGNEPFRIVGLRGRGKTFHLDGDALPAREVQRVYARWARTPPGGKRSWTRSREMPSAWQT
jgi:uncharacterized Zn finger protein